MAAVAAVIEGIGLMDLSGADDLLAVPGSSLVLESLSLIKLLDLIDFSSMDDDLLPSCIPEIGEAYEGEETIEKQMEPIDITARQCNMRKSLPWDSAFSTNEGVFDFEELGIVNKTSRKVESCALPAMQEAASKKKESTSMERIRTHQSKRLGGSESDETYGEEIVEKRMEVDGLLDSWEPIDITDGEYNMRKSLPWDSAFFSNEGVLDFQELGIVSKTSRKACALPATQDVANMQRKSTSVELIRSQQSKMLGEKKDESHFLKKSAPSLQNRVSVVVGDSNISMKSPRTISRATTMLNTGRKKNPDFGSKELKTRSTKVYNGGGVDHHSTGTLDKSSHENTRTFVSKPPSFSSFNPGNGVNRQSVVSGVKKFNEKSSMNSKPLAPKLQHSRHNKSPHETSKTITLMSSASPKSLSRSLTQGKLMVSKEKQTRHDNEVNKMVTQKSDQSLHRSVQENASCTITPKARLSWKPSSCLSQENVALSKGQHLYCKEHEQESIYKRHVHRSDSTKGTPLNTLHCKTKSLCSAVLDSQNTLHCKTKSLCFAELDSPNSLFVQPALCLSRSDSTESFDSKSCSFSSPASKRSNSTESFDVASSSSSLAPFEYTVTQPLASWESFSVIPSVLNDNSGTISETLYSNVPFVESSAADCTPIRMKSAFADKPSPPSRLQLPSLKFGYFDARKPQHTKNASEVGLEAKLSSMVERSMRSSSSMKERISRPNRTSRSK